MYLRTDEENEAIESLAMARTMVTKVSEHPSYWRWVIIALHNATQGFMVLSLRHGNSLMVLSKKSYKEWMDAYENKKPFPEERMDTFLALYRKVKQKKSIGGNLPFDPQVGSDRSMRRLNDLRNDFIHFIPKGLSLELDGLPEICGDCLKLVGFLGWESNNIYWHDPDLSERGQRIHYLLNKDLNSLQKMFNELRPTAD